MTMAAKNTAEIQRSDATRICLRSLYKVRNMIQFFLVSGLRWVSKRMSESLL